MADPLVWKEGEGFDIHILRDGPPSKALVNSFDIDPNFPVTQFPLDLDPHFKGAPAAHGVTVNVTTGTVKAGPHPSAAQPRLRNFLMTVRQQIPPASGGHIFETQIRIHIHDSVQKIWLTPNPLTIHTRFDETKFTVLALFDDGSVGDITDWPQLTFTSSDTAAVTILPGNIVSAEPGRPNEEMDVPVTATLKLTKPPTNLTATADATTRPNWRTMAERAQLQFITGPVRPIEQDLTSSKPNSVKSVVEGKTNVLFLSEGFLQTQDKHFAAIVDDIVKKEFRTDVLQPFKLLKDSINYWSLFQFSKQDGISVLGENTLGGTGNVRHASALPFPDPPATGAVDWSVENMIHEVGLPVPQDPVQSVAGWVTHWKKLYDTQVTTALVTKNFADWDALRTRMPLNERDSLFGIAHRQWPRVSETGRGDPLLRLSLRRTSEASLNAFIDRLGFGVPPPGGDPFPIGQTWINQNKDDGLVCFICLSDIGAGEARSVYFAATTGRDKLARVVAAPNGFDVTTFPISNPKALYSREIFASRVAHECAHALNLGDEYGPGVGAVFSGASIIFPNLQAKSAVTTTSPTGTTYDPTRIKWALPRTIKLSVVRTAPVPLSGSDFQMRLDPARPNPFKVGDRLQIREAPLRSSDPYLNHRFEVIQVFATAVDVRQKNVPLLDPNLFDPSKLYVLVCVNIKPGPELKLIAEPILTHIGAKNTPLTPAVCVGTANAQPFMMPVLPGPPNSPPLRFQKQPPSKADILGLYEGGGHVDCGIFRPAGRCKMRTADDKLIPFCYVCCYLIVDRVDATKLADLDGLYKPFYPFI